jgi:hypothetical protein
MKLKEGFVLREVAGDIVVIPSGDTLDLNMMITLNETGAFLWKRLQEETDRQKLIADLLGEYDVDEKTAQQAAKQIAGALFYDISRDALYVGIFERGYLPRIRGNIIHLAVYQHFRIRTGRISCNEKNYQSRYSPFHNI